MHKTGVGCILPTQILLLCVPEARINAYIPCPSSLFYVLSKVIYIAPPHFTAIHLVLAAFLRKFSDRCLTRKKFGQ